MVSRDPHTFLNAITISILIQQKKRKKLGKFCKSHKIWKEWGFFLKKKLLGPFPEMKACFKGSRGQRTTPLSFLCILSSSFELEVKTFWKAWDSESTLFCLNSVPIIKSAKRSESLNRKRDASVVLCVCPSLKRKSVTIWGSHRIQRNSSLKLDIDSYIPFSFVLITLPLFPTRTSDANPVILFTWNLHKLPVNFWNSEPYPWNYGIK